MFYNLQSRKGSAEVHLKEVGRKGMKRDKTVVRNFINPAVILEDETRLVRDEADAEESERR